jgi:hypothetical protein
MAKVFWQQVLAMHQLATADNVNTSRPESAAFDLRCVNQRGNASVDRSASAVY